MKTLIIVLVLVTAAPVFAAPFDGSWIADPASYKAPDKIVTRLLKDGVYSNPNAAPPIKVAADGKFHAVKNDPYADEIMVAVVDKTTLRQATRKGGKEMGSSVFTVSPDSKTLTIAYTDKSAPGGTSTGSNLWTRVAPAPAGAHAVSGKWKQTGVADMSANALELSLKDSGKALTLSTPTGVTYTATYGGPAVAITGDPGKTMAAVKRAGADKIVETDTRNGKVVNVSTFSISKDGKTLTVDNDDKEYGAKTQWTAHKK